MSDSLPQVFQFRTAQVRIVMHGESPWFVGADVCAALGYSNPTKAIADHCKGAEILTSRDVSFEVPNRGLTIIPESDLYRLIMRSKMADAEAFQDWVTGEVLPSIRKTGGYLTPQLTAEALKNPDILIPLLENSAQQLRQWKERCALQEREIKVLAPKAEYAEEVLQSSGLHTVNSIAVHLGVSAIKLNKWLEGEGIIYRRGGIIYPRADLRGKGLCDFHVVPYIDRDGNKQTREHLKWTEAGRKWIIAKWNKKHTQPALEM